MEAKPKISRYLILIVIIFFVIIGLALYGILSSEKLTIFAINNIVEKYVSVDNLNVKLTEVKGSLLKGITIERIDIKHIKPKFEAVASNFVLKPLFENIFSGGKIQINGSLSSLKYVGTLNFPIEIASVPAFIGYECFAGLPANIKINSFNIDKINIIPTENKSLEIVSNNFKIKESSSSDNLEVLTDFVVNWKDKILAKTAFNGTYEQRKNKLNGNIKIDIAKQIINSELLLAKSKKGIEISGYIASDTLIDLMPLSQWLGYLWQLEYPYSLSGKIFCQGSWLYNSEVGFLGNLNGKYEKIDISIIGLFFSLLELNGDWKLFDGSLNITDTGSKLVGAPASLSGKIESLTNNSNRKWNLSFESNSLQLNKITDSIPWMVRYSNGIPSLEGIATFSILLKGNRPSINAKLELNKLKEITKNTTHTYTNGNLYFNLPEKGIGAVNGNFIASSKKGLPIFFRRLNKKFYDYENDEYTPTSFKYAINGNLNETLKLDGSLIFDNETRFKISGDYKEENFFLKLITEDNHSYNSKAIDPIDLLLMR